MLMCHGEVDQKERRSSQFLIDALTILGSSVGAYASTCDLQKNVIVDFKH